MKKNIKKVAALVFAYMVFFQNKLVYADSLQGSKLVTGTKNLISDASKSILILAPIIGGVFGMWYFLKLQGTDDEGDIRLLKKRIRTVFIATIGVVLVSSIITIVVAYYQ